LTFLSPRSFFIATGAVLALLGLFGLVLDGVGAGDRTYFTADAVQNVSHLGAGLVALLLAVRLAQRPKALKWLAVLAAIAGLFLGVYGLLGEWPERGPLASPTFADTWVLGELPGATEYALSIVWGVSALVAAFRAHGTRDSRPGV